MKYLTKISSLSCLLFCTPIAANAGILFGVSNFSNELVSIDPATGFATPIGNTGVVFPRGLAYDRNANIMYGYDSHTDTISTVNLNTGFFSMLPMTLGIDGFSGGLAFDPNSGTLYFSDNGTDSLYTVDPITGVGSLSGAHGVANIDSLAFDPNSGVLYGASGNTDSLYSIDTNTGAASAIGSGIGFDLGSSGLAYDYENDILYLNDENTDALYTVDVTTGVASLVGANGIITIQGLAYAPIPEPGTGVLIALTSFAFLCWRRRNN